MPGLTPTARSVDTYARPQAPQQGNEELQFASALATISPGLRNLMEDESNRQQAEQEAKANRMLGGMTYQQARDAMDNGMPEMENEWFKSAAMSQYGESQAHFRINELTQLYATEFDAENGNLDELISTKMADDLEKYGDNKFFVSTYSALMDDFRANAMQKHTENRSAIAVDKAKGGVFDVTLGTARQMREAGKTPQEINAAIGARYKGNADLLNIDYKAQDAELMRVVDVFAQAGDLEMVEGLLNGERLDADGNSRPSLGASREFAADSARLLVTAENKRNENNQDNSFSAIKSFTEDANKGILDPAKIETFMTENPGAITPAHVQSLITQSSNEVERLQNLAATNAGKIQLENLSIRAREELRRQNLLLGEKGQTPFFKPVQLPDAHGEMKEITVDQQNEWLAEDIVSRTDALVASGDITPEQKVNLQIEHFATAGIENPQWENVLSAGVSGANAWSISGNDTAPPALVEGAKLYMEMYAKSPQLLNRHIKDGEIRRFYETYRVGIQRAGMEPQQAYSHAVAVTRLPPIDNPMASISRGDLEAAVGRIGNSSGSWFGGDDGYNTAYVAQEIMSAAADYSVGGTLTAKAAIEEAEKDYYLTHRIINGQWVNTSDRFTPDNFEDMTKVVLEDYVMDFGAAEGLTINDLTIRPSTNGAGAWEIVQKGAIPLPVDDASRRNFTLDGMNGRMIKRTEAKALELGKTQAEAQATAEHDRLNQLKSEITSGESFLNTPNYQSAFAGRNGAGALETEIKAVQGRIKTQKLEIEALEYSAALRAVENRKP